MNPFQFLLRFFDPIPTEQQHLVEQFYQESENTVYNIVQAMGGIGLIAIIAMMIQYTSVLLFNFEKVMAINVAIGIISVCFVMIRYISPKYASVYLVFFVGTVGAIILNSIAAFLASNGYVLGFDLLTVIVLIAAVTPWQTIWVLRVQMIILMLILIINFIISVFYGTLITTSIFTAFFSLISSPFIHRFLTKQRWDSFFNKHQVQLLTERLQGELALAQKIQRSLFPNPFPKEYGLHVACYSEPAYQVGGDFYRYHSFGNDMFAFSVGDVSGKGMSAALLMAVSLSHFDALLSENLTPAERMTKLDKAFVPYAQTTENNCALCYIEISPTHANSHEDAQWREVTIVNAGCIEPIVKRADNSVSWIEAGGMPLGVGLGSQLGYQSVTIKLHQGDIIILTSDGVVEAVNHDHVLFGFDRLETAVQTGPTTTVFEMLTHILTQVSNFVGDAEPHDDLTIVVVQI